MKLPNWFKIAWWVFLIAATTSILSLRYKDMLAGRSIPVDALILLARLPLLLMPLFQEISFFGMTLKKEMEALRSNLRDEVASLRTEIRNSVDVRTQISPSIVFPSPPPDSQLPLIEARINTAIEDALRNLGLQRAEDSVEQLTASDDVQFLFRVRYNIERELRRIWQQRTQEESPRRRFIPTLRVAQSLAELGFIDRGIEGAIREVWLVASSAIHGESVTARQVAFVQDVAPRLVAALKAV